MSKIKRKPLSQATQKYLTSKSKESGIKKSILTQVYRRGQGAYLGSGSRNVSMAAWARGRVNSFVSGKGKARQADADLWRKRKA